ncbi:MAG: type II toxin-antitoxin system VapC family toxin [Actinomycetota bacterium]|nr:type II toxin-antitoxin system VapC family toxin [Actinomycetota bacterium]
MSGSVVLDNAALAALADGRGPVKEAVRAALTAAVRLQRDVVVPAVVLAEMYRGRHDNQVVDACLSRETGLLIRETDRTLARLVGGVLAGAGAGSEHMVDAHVVATAVESGGGVCLTGDPEDLTALSASYPHVTVLDINA